MMSTVLPSEALLTHGNTNPLFPLYGGFTPWESLEYFFTSSEKHDESKPNLTCYHAGLALDSDSSNQKSPCHVEPNLGSYHAGLDLDLESQNEKSPCFDQTNLSCYHVGSDLGSETPNQQSPCSDKYSNDQHQPTQNSPVSSSSSGGSDDPNQNRTGPGLNSCQDNLVEGVTAMDERKRKRMVSNRESARRSRMRKQQHVENLRNDVNKLKTETRERSNQLRLMTHQIHLVRRENDRLKTESIILQRKLMQLSQYWQLQQLQQQCSYDYLNQ